MAEYLKLVENQLRPKQPNQSPETNKYGQWNTNHQFLSRLMATVGFLPFNAKLAELNNTNNQLLQSQQQKDKLLNPAQIPQGCDTCGDFGHNSLSCFMTMKKK